MTLNKGLDFLLGSVLLHLHMGGEAGWSEVALGSPWLHLGYVSPSTWVVRAWSASCWEPSATPGAFGAGSLLAFPSPGDCIWPVTGVARLPGLYSFTELTPWSLVHEGRDGFS